MMEKIDPSKSWFSKEPHGITNQEAAFFIVSP
jgi:hypothetical protein